jgi:hypothetical protein
MKEPQGLNGDSKVVSESISGFNALLLRGKAFLLTQDMQSYVIHSRQTI